MIKYFSLPGWYCHNQYILDIIKYWTEHREEFFEDRVIGSVFDYYPNLIWGGGRYVTKINYELPMENVLAEYNKFPDISIRHVFTNLLLDEDMVRDHRCNQFVKNYVRPQDGIILANYALDKHIQTNYPNIQRIYSTTLDIKDIELVNKLTENNIYVLNYTFNNDDEYIKRLKHPENIEVLCADTCVFDCPRRKWHYEKTSRVVLYNEEPYNCNASKCNDGTKDPFALMLTQPQAVTNERVEQLSAMGINNFKICGRGEKIPLLLEYILYYLAKPEYFGTLKRRFFLHWW